MNPVVHFEMPYEDRDRVAEFYAKAFGWKAQKFGEEMGNYVVAVTGESGDPSGRPTKPGYINGGFYKKSEKNFLPSVVISVDDIQAAMKKVKEAGGTLIDNKTGESTENGEPDMIPGIGLWVSFKDSEGNRVSMLQPRGV